MSSNSTYHLHPILYPALPPPPPPEGLHSSPDARARSVRCAEGNGNLLYVGTSDGILHLYEHAGEDYTLLKSRVVSSNAKPIERILPLPAVGLIAVLAESILTFLVPDLENAARLPRISGVAAAVVDDAELETGGADGLGSVSLCIVRRRQVVLAKLGQGGYTVVKELSLTLGATLARRYGDTLCIATTSTYSLVNLSEGVTNPLSLPISQASSAPSAAERPSIVAIGTRGGKCEFLITSHTPSVTLGVFVENNGEIAAKMLEWPSHPRSLSLDGHFLSALLRNDTIETHDVRTLTPVQLVHLPSALEPRLLSSGLASLSVVETRGAALLTPINVGLTGKDDEVAQESMENGEDQAAFLIHSRTLLIGRDAVQVLLRAPFVSRAARMAQQQAWSLLVSLAHEAWAALESNEPGVRLAEVQFTHALVAMWHVRNVRFGQATRYFVHAKLDPKLLIRWLQPERAPRRIVHNVSLPRGLVNEVKGIQSASEIIFDNLELNYAPPLNVRADESCRKLHDALLRRYEEMVRDVLIAHRGTCFETSNGPSEQRAISDSITDTALAKLLALETDGTALRALFGAPNACYAEEVEPLLHAAGMYAALAQLHAARGEVRQTLQLWTRLVDGKLTDAAWQGSVSDVVRLLEQSSDQNLVREWGVWVVQRDAEAGIRLLTRKGAPGSSAAADALPNDALEDHRRTLTELKRLDASSAEAFLEHMVLARSQHVPELHEELMQLLLERVGAGLDDTKLQTEARNNDERYKREAGRQSYVSHLASRVETDPLVLERLKLIMLLQGSSSLNVHLALSHIELHVLLTFERAVLLGRLERHQEVLSLLATEIGDVRSAQAYCIHPGLVLSPALVDTVATRHGLKLYASLVARHHSSLSVAPFEAQGILSLVKDALPLQHLEGLLGSALRRQLHLRREAQITRALALAQNLEVSENAWAQLRAMGGVIQESQDDAGSDCPPPSAVATKAYIEEETAEKIITGAASEKGAYQEEEEAVDILA